MLLFLKIKTFCTPYYFTTEKRAFSGGFSDKKARFSVGKTDFPMENPTETAVGTSPVDPLVPTESPIRRTHSDGKRQP